VTRLRWIVSSEASALHAAAALAEGREIVDTRLAAALAEPAAKLFLALKTAALAPADFVRHAIPLVCRADNLDLAELIIEAAKRGTDRELSASGCDAVVRALDELIAAQDVAIPDLPQQLAVRTAPLAEQWEARGPGLLAQIGRSTDRSLIPAEVDVALVYPVCGGGGAASMSYNLVRIEAVLANPCAEVPEVVRLGWLIAQSKFEQPPSGFEWTPRQSETLAAVALAPAALEAAEYVELARFDAQTLQQALDSWGLAEALRSVPAQLLHDWWNESSEWKPSLLSLKAMLRDSVC